MRLIKKIVITCAFFGFLAGCATQTKEDIESYGPGSTSTDESSAPEVDSDPYPGDEEPSAYLPPVEIYQDSSSDTDSEPDGDEDGDESSGDSEDY